MKRKAVIARWVVAVLLVVGSGVAVARHMHAGLGGPFGRPQVLAPAGTPKALVIVLPDVDAPERARSAARRLAEQGALVAVVDTRHYLRAAARGDALECGRLARDAERLGKKLLRKQGVDVFLTPLLVGDGQGALLARQMLAAADPDSLAGAVVADAAAAGDGLACASPPPAPEQGVLVPVALASSPEQLAQAARAHFPGSAGAGLAGLPLVEMHVPGSHRLAIVISGDGGWRDLDKSVSAELVRQGVSVVGWNALCYFWKEKTPQQASADLARVLQEYRRRWHADDVALVGYSFGADVMPFLYPRLPESERRDIHFVSLLGLAHGADFRIRVGGWLGFGGSRQQPILPELARMNPAQVQCIQGVQEKDTLCPELRERGVEVVERPGGHHFDHDPAKLSSIILQGWKRAIDGEGVATRG